MWKILFSFFCAIGIFVFLKMLYRVSKIWAQFCLYRKKDFRSRYGEGSYVVITGASRGQGRQFAYQFAKGGMNLILIGSPGVFKVKSTIQKKFPDCRVVAVHVDFARAFEPCFFEPIEKVVSEYDVSIVVNNVGYRTGCLRYEMMPLVEIKKCLAVCTMTQAVMVQIALRRFSKRRQQTKKQCAIINNTAQCTHPTDLFALSPEICLPYLSVYEASKAFDFFHSNSIQKEIKQRKMDGQIDYLTITPGAVITETTEPTLKNTMFSVSDTEFVSNILTTLGNKNGVVCGSAGHAMSGLLINLCPFIKKRVLHTVGHNIASEQEKRFNSN